MRRKFLYTQPELENLYLIQKLTILAIAKKAGVGSTTVTRYLRLFGIPSRKSNDYEPAVKKGSTLPEAWRANIKKGLANNPKLKGRKGCINPNTGRSYRYSCEVINCAFCENPFEIKQYRLTHFKNNFCSRKCRDLWKKKNAKGNSKIPLFCAECNCIFERRVCYLETNLKRGHERFFCGRKCFGIWLSKNRTGEECHNFKGGYKHYYGPSWCLARQQTRVRDGNICKRCGKTKEKEKRNMQVHHIQPFRLFGLRNHKEANKLDNLVCYCGRCHRITEKEYCRKEKSLVLLYLIKCGHTNSIKV